MAKAQTATAVRREPARKVRGGVFEPTPTQRGFVAAAAGLGVPHEVICQLLPGERAGERVAIPRAALEKHFAEELRQGLNLAIALVGARVFERALSKDDRSALTAQTLILNTRGGWKSAGDQPSQAPLDPPLALDELTREERDLLRQLLTKAMAGTTH